MQYLISPGPVSVISDRLIIYRFVMCPSREASFQSCLLVSCCDWLT